MDIRSDKVANVALKLRMQLPLPFVDFNCVSDMVTHYLKFIVDELSIQRQNLYC